MNAEGVVVIGGHSVDDAEMKFGYAVTGLIDPAKVVRNSGAKPGDVLVLTKPIGTGAINTAVKRGIASDKAVAAAIEAMTTSAAAASKVMIETGASACTDITGFGLLGHAYEMAKASQVTFRLDANSVPLLPDVIDLISQGMLTRGDRNNRIYVGEKVRFAGDISAHMQSALFDPQTAGGLLISLNPDAAGRFMNLIPAAAVIGNVRERGDVLIEVN
jgi:selenide,water dikinase